MGPYYYEIIDIQGDYAQLRRTDAEGEPILPVAMALLPMESDIGTKLRWMMGIFEVIA